MNWTFFCLSLVLVAATALAASFTPPSSSATTPTDAATTHSTPEKLNWSDVEKSVYSDAEGDASTRTALDVIEKAIEDYGPEALSISFNGGKDCTALLHLTVAALSRHFSKKTPSSLPPKLRSFYEANPEKLFEEEGPFVEETETRYNLDRMEINPATVKKPLEEFLVRNPKIKAIFMGTRKTDPHGGNVEHFTMTDPTYVNPPVMRVSPILNWTYDEIWSFIRRLNVPYLSLYDKGYTSIGDKDSTRPNPELLNTHRECGYDPAWMLKNPDQERAGRKWPNVSTLVHFAAPKRLASTKGPSLGHPVEI